MIEELIIWAIIGIVSGAFFGLIPGAGPFIAVALLYPLLASTRALNIMMYYVAVLITANYTNSVTAILYGIPGDATAISTAREGHRLYRKGFGSLAVSSNAISSSIGVIFALVVFITVLPNILQVFKFYNSIVQTVVIFSAITMITFLTKQNKLITLILFSLGGVLARVGIDPITFDSFATFGNPYLSLGIPFASIMIGLYIVPELAKVHNLTITKTRRINTFAVGKDTMTATLLGSFIGFWCGLIPGVTNILGSYASANIVKRFFRKPVLKSIAAAEAANNSGALSSLLPLLILAIPITGSEVLVYYLMLENGFVFTAENTINKLHSIIYIIPFITVICLILSWYGFNLLARVAYFYKTYRTIVNLLILTTISTVSIMTFPIHIWMLVCILCLSVLGYTLRHLDTSPAIYGFFLSDLFYESLIRAIVIIS
jgi:putative tricarboxylic transport membrane protein